MRFRGEGDGAQAEIRRRNLSRILRELHVSRPLSRSELAERLHLDRSTVASLVGELAARGMVQERHRSKLIPQSPGRPSPVVELRQDGPGALALDIATDWLGAAVVALGGRIVASTRRDVSLCGSTPEKVMSDLGDIVRPLLAGLENGPRVVAIGVSVPGLVRSEDGQLLEAPALAWFDVPMGRLVGDEFADLNVPVFVGNDADLAASAEHLRGSGRGTTDFICVWGEGGLGAGIVVGGRLLAGSAGYAGEVGHVTIDPDGELCHCGARGCLESVAGEEALLRRSGRDPLGGTAALEDLIAAADRGDQLALSALAESGRGLGVGISGLVNIFNPNRVALGGLYARVYPYVRGPILRELEGRAMSAPRAMVDLVTVRLGGNALLLGAAELALAPTLYDPAMVPLRRHPAAGEAPDVTEAPGAEGSGLAARG
ncbi:MAG: ROK family transcriptional regulator [Candidatus Limnocylindrales bacterium]